MGGGCQSPRLLITKFHVQRRQKTDYSTFESSRETLSRKLTPQQQCKFDTTTASGGSPSWANGLCFSRLELRAVGLRWPQKRLLILCQQRKAGGANCRLQNLPPWTLTTIVSYLHTPLRLRPDEPPDDEPEYVPTGASAPSTLSRAASASAEASDQAEDSPS